MTIPNEAPLPDREPSVRERLADAALRLFNERGYAATSVREIVEAAGVTKPVLYYHFESKEGLYNYLISRGFEEFTVTLAAARRETGPVVERLRHLLDSVYRLFGEHTAEVRLMHAIFYGPPQGAPPFDFDRYHRQFEEEIGRLVVEGMEAGELRPDDPHTVAMVIIGTINVAMELHLCHPDRDLGPGGVLRMFDIVLRGIAPNGAAPSPYQAR